jgi:hypothetical protein
MAKRHGPDGESTMRTVRDRADQYDQERPRIFSGTAIAVPEIPEHIARPLSLVAGLGIGGLLLVLAATSGYAATTWADIGRTGGVTAYALTAFFLTVAGLGCTLATLNHHMNVLKHDAHHH